MPPVGKYLIIPLKVTPQMFDIPGDIQLPVFEVPTVTEPVTIPVTPAPSPPLPSTNFPVRDIISQLPYNLANLPNPAKYAKDSVTFHWEGPDAIPQMNDEQTVWYLKGIANFHINKDWGNGQRGAYIMYHEAIAQSGTSLILHDYTDVVWHCGNDEGNRTSRAILVVCSRATPPTQAQMLAIGIRIREFRRSTPGWKGAFPHSRWSATECPGDQIRTYLPTQ